ncbi:hypothetical protein OAO87_03235, partial [bacterium]|nr:hypothetical protein [bacterium]
PKVCQGSSRLLCDCEILEIGSRQPTDDMFVKLPKLGFVILVTQQLSITLPVAQPAIGIPVQSG